MHAKERLSSGLLLLLILGQTTALPTMALLLANYLGLQFPLRGA